MQRSIYKRQSSAWKRERRSLRSSPTFWQLSILVWSPSTSLWRVLLNVWLGSWHWLIHSATFSGFCLWLSKHETQHWKAFFCIGKESTVISFIISSNLLWNDFAVSSKDEFIFATWGCRNRETRVAFNSQTLMKFQKKIARKLIRINYSCFNFANSEQNEPWRWVQAAAFARRALESFRYPHDACGVGEPIVLISL